ncbi:hypothetical protein DXG01_008089, partial [Tephrocybe rancida]
EEVDAHTVNTSISLHDNVDVNELDAIKSASNVKETDIDDGELNAADGKLKAYIILY